ncbi:hypothetical protein ACLOJK_018017 [Asimina triloba]
MASTEKQTTSSYSHDTARTVPGTPPSAAHPPSINLFVIDLALRLLLFASTLTALVVMVTGKQTEMVIVSPLNPVPVSRIAKFNHSPAFIYLVVAVCIGCLYSILTAFSSLASISKPSPSNKLLFWLAIHDAPTTSKTRSNQTPSSWLDDVTPCVGVNLILVIIRRH